MGIGVQRFADAESPIARRHPDSRTRHDCWGRLVLPVRQGTRPTIGPARLPLLDAAACIVAFALFPRSADAPRCPEPHLCVAAQSARTPAVPSVSPPAARRG